MVALVLSLGHLWEQYFCIFLNDLLKDSECRVPKLTGEETGDVCSSSNFASKEFRVKEC